MSKVIFSIDKSSIKALFPEIIENALTKNNKIKKSSIKKVSEHMIKELILNIPCEIKSNFKDSNIKIEYEYNKFSNDIFFTIDWNKQNFKKMCRYEVIFDFQINFVNDFSKFIRSYDNNNWCKVKNSSMYTGYIINTY